MSAFACEPGRGSEQEVGWRWAVEMSRWFDVTVLTQTRNRIGIERELAKGISDGHCLQFEYFQFPDIIYKLKSRFDPLTWPYYFFWQIAIARVAARMHSDRPFALAHHVTFVSFRIPVWLKALGIPVVFGPVGGAEKAPFNLLKRGFGPLIWSKEVIRNAATSICAQIIKWLPPIHSKQGICLAATPGMSEIFSNAGFPNEIFPAIGMDSSPTDKRDDGASTNGIRFLFVGRFHPLKGVHLLLEAFARADISNASLTLIGGGADETILRKLADKLGIADKLIWKGKLPRTELPANYRQHHLLVAPSLYESGGLTVLEAMSEGLPSIVLDVGGHSVSVIEECGMKISPIGSVDDVIDRLRQAMKFYASHPNRISQQGLAASKRLKSEYSWGYKALRMKGIYDRLISHVSSP
jgi:glycosyltransferase involved in cell wall biosynthesis